MDNLNRNTEAMIEEKLPLSRNIVLSFQHLFLMNAYVVPVILASIIGLSGVFTNCGWRTNILFQNYSR